MKYLMTFDTPADAPPPSPEQLEALGKFTQEMIAAGVVKMIAAGVVKLTGGLAPASMGGAKVRSKGGQFAVVDGPYTEAKEVVVGFAVIEAANLDEALNHCRRFMAIAGDGEGSIQPIFEGGA